MSIESQIANLRRKLEQISRAIESTQDFKVLLACITTLGALPDEELATDAIPKDSASADILKTQYRQVSIICERLQTRNMWLYQTGAYGTFVDERSLLQWPVPKDLLEDGIKLDRVLRPVDKYWFLRLWKNLAQLRDLAEEFTFQWESKHFVSFASVGELLTMGLESPYLIPLHEKTFLEASLVVSNEPFRFNASPGARTISLQDAISVQELFGGQSFFLGFRNRDPASLRRAAAHFRTIVRFFADDSECDSSPVPVKDLTEELNFSSVLSFLAKHEHKRTDRLSYKVHQKDSAEEADWTIDLPWSEYWFVGSLLPEHQAQYHADPLKFVLDHSSEFTNSQGVQYLRLKINLCESLAHEAELGQFIDGFARLMASIASQVGREVRPISRDLVDPLSKGSIVALSEVIAHLALQGSFTEQDIARVLIVKIVTDFLERARHRKQSSFRAVPN